eukprot:3412320-Rhodomonas_salina.1
MLAVQIGTTLGELISTAPPRSTRGGRASTSPVPPPLCARLARARRPGHVLASSCSQACEEVKGRRSSARCGEGMGAEDEGEGGGDGSWEEREPSKATHVK